MPGKRQSAPKGRSCGGCTACCISLDIPELGKKAGVPCEYATENGCSIYERTRIEPQFSACRSFRCLWLQGWGEQQERPDRSGLLYYDAPENANAEHFQRYGKPLTAVETREGAYRSLLGSLLVEDLIRESGRPVAVRFLSGETTLVGAR